MGSYYATSPVIFSDHSLAVDIPELVYNPFGLVGPLTGAGGRWTDDIWMLHGKTPYDIIAVLADIGWVVWSNSDYKYPIVTAKAVHTERLDGEFMTTLCKDLGFTNERTKAWITGDYGFVDSFPVTGWDCIVYLSGPEIERDSWQKRCILEYILQQCEDVETMGDFVVKDGKVGIAVQYSNNPPHEGSTKTSALEKAIGDALAEDFLIYQSTRHNDSNTIEFLRSTDFDVDVEDKKSMYQWIQKRIQQVVNQSSVFIEEKGQIQICTQDGVVNKRNCSEFLETVLTGLPPDVTLFFAGSDFQFNPEFLERMDQLKDHNPIRQQLMGLQNMGIRVNPNGYRLKFNCGNIQPATQATLLQVVKEILNIIERIILDHYTWTFSHYDYEHWQLLTEKGDKRILLLGADPNDQNVAGRQDRDMGQWFRTALPDRFHNYKFYTNNMLQLCGALGLQTFGQQKRLQRQHGHMTEFFQAGSFTEPLRHLRYADIKALGGVGESNSDEITAYARQNLPAILEFWFPQDGSLPPTHTVIQGDNAKEVFKEIILPELRARKQQSPNWTGAYTYMSHPSWQGSYEDMRISSLAMTWYQI